MWRQHSVTYYSKESIMEWEERTQTERERKKKREEIGRVKNKCQGKKRGSKKRSETSQKKGSETGSETGSEKWISKKVPQNVRRDGHVPSFLTSSEYSECLCFEGLCKHAVRHVQKKTINKSRIILTKKNAYTRTHVCFRAAFSHLFFNY